MSGIVRALVAPAVIVAAFLLGNSGSAPVPGSTNADKLIGATVYAANGVAVGQVSDVSTTAEGGIDALRVRTASPLGLGERIVVIRKGDFRIARRGVLLEFTAAELGMFPSDLPEREPAEKN
jgi:sporulation protein YlmC with PRC-barrel domain